MRLASVAQAIEEHARPRCETGYDYLNALRRCVRTGLQKPIDMPVAVAAFGLLCEGTTGFCIVLVHVAVHVARVYRGGGLYKLEFLHFNFCAKILHAICSGVFKDLCSY